MVTLTAPVTPLVSILGDDDGFESPKKFSDLRKNSANKDSKNTSNAQIGFTSATKKLVVQHPSHHQEPITTKTVSPRNLFHRPAVKANSPNSFKDIIQQQ